MTSHERPGSGHQRGRAHATARASYALRRLHRVVLRRQKVTADRFHQPSAWLRLVALGFLLVDLALLTLANTHFDPNIGGYRPGMGSVFAGALIVIIIVRLARPLLYLDWIAVGMLKIALGLVLGADSSSAKLLVFALFGLIFTILSLLKLWIGLTYPPGRAAASLTAGGFVSLFCVMGLVVARVANLGIGADTILAIDLTITGFSIIGFGLALRPPPRSDP